MARVQGPSVFDAHVHFVQRWNHASGHKEKDGHWPSLDVASDLQFPTEIASPKKGNSRVQLLRTIRTGSYTSPKGFKYPIEKGEASILAQVIATLLFHVFSIVWRLKMPKSLFTSKINT